MFFFHTLNIFMFKNEVFHLILKRNGKIPKCHFLFKKKHLYTYVQCTSTTLMSDLMSKMSIAINTIMWQEKKATIIPDIKSDFMLFEYYMINVTSNKTMLTFQSDVASTLTCKRQNNGHSHGVHANDQKMDMEKNSVLISCVGN